MGSTAEQSLENFKGPNKDYTIWKSKGKYKEQNLGVTKQ